MGNFAPTYFSNSQSEYYDKTSMRVRNERDANIIGPMLRKTNYVLGHDKPEYLSETALKFKLPLASSMSSAYNKIKIEQKMSCNLILRNYRKVIMYSVSRMCQG